MKISLPYLLYTGDADATFGAKTAEGVLHWCPDQCVAQSASPNGSLDLGIKRMSLEEAYAAGARTVLLGVTNRGGIYPAHWTDDLVKALEIGYDIASGLHDRLADQPALNEAAERHGRQLHDVRHWSGAPIPMGTGRNRTGKRALMIGTDCAVGKKFSALAVHRALVKQGANATFRATGQTGVLIAGEGIAIDAVPADFISGAVEMISPDNDESHWDVIEGQASVLHPSFAGVTLGLVHGAQPDAMILCHEPGRKTVRGLDERPLPNITDTIRAHEIAAMVTNRNAKVVGVSLDTHRLPEAEASAAVDA
ncbi:MAG: DUF1611 domain-containing protein, partial [Pseudomonadota bacterium]